MSCSSFCLLNSRRYSSRLPLRTLEAVKLRQHTSYSPPTPDSLAVAIFPIALQLTSDHYRSSYQRRLLILSLQEYIFGESTPTRVKYLTSGYPSMFSGLVDIAVFTVKSIRRRLACQASLMDHGPSLPITGQGTAV